MTRDRAQAAVTPVWSTVVVILVITVQIVLFDFYLQPHYVLVAMGFTLPFAMLIGIALHLRLTIERKEVAHDS